MVPDNLCTISVINKIETDHITHHNTLYVLYIHYFNRYLQSIFLHHL